MSDQQVEGYATAMFEVARAEDVLGRVVDELFRFSRAVDSSPDLRSALTDPASPAEAKERIVGELLQDRAHPVTSRLVNLVVEAGLVRELTRIVDTFTAKASASGQA